MLHPGVTKSDKLTRPCQIPVVMFLQDSQIGLTFLGDALIGFEGQSRRSKASSTASRPCGVHVVGD
jgi:hypothetical protein